MLVGDGTRTLEELIWRHPRFRNQAAVFLERFADERDRVPPRTSVLLGPVGESLPGDAVPGWGGPDHAGAGA